MDFLTLEKDISFHRAFADAHYTAKILARILAEKPAALRNLSYDVFHPPKDRKSELKVQFDNYAKYISREFDTKEEALRLHPSLEDYFLDKVREKKGPVVL